MDFNELVDEVERIYPELMEMLRRRHPEYIPLYMMRYEYVVKPYPPAMRMHNAIQILETYTLLKKEAENDE